MTHMCDYFAPQHVFVNTHYKAKRSDRLLSWRSDIFLILILLFDSQELSLANLDASRNL